MGKKFWNPDSGAEPLLAEDCVVSELGDSDDSERLSIEFDEERSKVTLRLLNRPRPVDLQ